MNEVKTNQKGRPLNSGNGACRPLEKNEIRELFGVCFGKNGLRNRAIIALGVYGGMRCGTICNLKVTQVLDCNLKVRSTVAVTANNEKSRRSHRYIIAPVGQKIIQEYVDSLMITYGDEYLFRSIRGGKIANTSMSRLITNLMKKADITDTSSHSLRKSYSHGLLSLGLSLPQISKCLNHAQVTTTMRYLGNHEPDIQNAVSNLKF